MRNPSLYRVGGNAFAVGGLLLILGLLLRSPLEPAHPVMGAVDPAILRLTSVTLMIAAFLVLAGVLALARHFQDDALEGIATLASAAGIPGLLAVGGCSALGIVVSSEVNGAPAAAEGMEGTLGALAVLGDSLERLGWSFVWICAGLFAYAMLRDGRAWPRWIAATGLAIAPVQLALPYLIDESGIAMSVLQIVGFTWIATVGVVMAGLARPHAARRVSSLAPR